MEPETHTQLRVVWLLYSLWSRKQLGQYDLSASHERLVVTLRARFVVDAYQLATREPKFRRSRGNWEEFGGRFYAWRMGLFQWGSKTNEAMNRWAAKVDGPTGIAARDAAGVISLGVKILRWPTLALLVLVAPSLAATGLIAALNDGLIGSIAAVVVVVELGVWVLFAWRRQQILTAIDDTNALASQIGVAAEMSGRPAEIAGVLTTLNANSGPRIWNRLRSTLSKTQTDAVWIRQVSDLDRARWFFPPSVGRTMTLAVAMLWLVPVSAVSTFLLFVAAIAN